MANDEHVALLKQGVAAWNAWRDKDRNIHPDLSLADLNGAELNGADLSFANLKWSGLREANLSKANLSWADLTDADLSGADLRRAVALVAYLGGANLSGADLAGARLEGAKLMGARLKGANLSGADLVGANLAGADGTEVNLGGADLRVATLVNTNLTLANLTGCRIHGVSAWDLKLERAKQENLVITPEDEPEITVDNIEVAQFIYLMLHNQKIRDVIDTITSKAVLILGRFTAERKSVLDAIREELRRRDYLPILFDFDKPANRDLSETISLLARMARFVVADITDAKAIPQELNVIVPHLPSVPVQPLLLRERNEYGMFEHYARYPWVLPLYRYETQDQLIAALGEHVIEPAERKSSELRSGAKPIPPIAGQS